MRQASTLEGSAYPQISAPASFDNTRMIHGDLAPMNQEASLPSRSVK